MLASPREVFYRDVALFKSQRVVDQLLDDVTATFRLERRDMNIRASPKGLVCGEGLTIELLCGDRINVNTMGGTLIPVMEDVKAYHVSEGIRWVLVVEKEAVFNALCHLHLVEHPTLSAQGLLITVCHQRSLVEKSCYLPVRRAKAILIWRPAT